MAKLDSKLMPKSDEPPIILIIDDSPEILAIASSLLVKDYRVKATKKGVRGLQLAESSPQPTLVLLDYLMPEMNGDEVCRLLKENPATSDIPVIFMTASSDESTKKHLLGLGAIDLITKPLNGPLLRERIEAIICFASETLVVSASKDAGE